MKTMPIKGELVDAIVRELGQGALFRDLSENDLRQIANNATMVQYDQGETIMQQGENSNSFYLVASGEVIIKVKHEARNELVEIARVKPYDTIGELGLLLNQPRSSTVVAGQDVVLLKFDEKFFADMFKELPDFGLVTCRVLAGRLQQASRNIPLPVADSEAIKPDPEAQNLLPMEFIQRHRVLPLKAEANVLHLGFVEDPTPQVINLARQLLPGMELRPVVVDVAIFNSALQSAAGAEQWTAPASAPAKKAKGTVSAPPSVSQSKSPRLDQLLKRMVAEGASDVHMSAGQKLRWRIDGDIHEIEDASVLGPSEMLDLVGPIMLERNRVQFDEANDTDFAYAIPNVARFRVNLFRDNKGVGAVFRQIPDKILTIEQLGLPEVVRTLCDYPKGLILVTGPTGSGKSTTLAAMVDHINKTRKAHIITLEDPIEFVHQSQKCLVNQREVGPHTTSFSHALRAALREDPDIVLVGEMRDLETVALALETANTGHLVFGTLHTNTAVSTLSRIIDMFPAEQQNQVRTALADSLKGVVAQSLCRKIGGGRIAALEILVSDLGVASLIREGKPQQLFSAMQTGKARGNRLLNEELARLVTEKIVERDEAMSKAVDKADLAKKFDVKSEEKK